MVQEWLQWRIFFSCVHVTNRLFQAEAINDVINLRPEKPVD